MTINKENYSTLIKIIAQEYLDTPELERSLTKLQTKYGIKRQKLSSEFKKLGIEIINYQNRLRLNENIFDTIDTEEKAYWLGFLYADGNISSKEDKIEMNLSARDVEHMIKFQKFLNLENDVRIRPNYGKGDEQCRISFRNKRVWNALNEKGCVPAKSLILKFPRKNIFVNQNLIYDFIRGYCDGDGTLGFYNKKNTKSCELGFVGTPDFLLGIQQFLGFWGYFGNKSCKNWENKAYELKYYGVTARKIARLLYENSNVYLDRKYKIYEQFCRFEEQSLTAKSSKIERGWNANIEVNSEITKGSESPYSVEGE